MLMTELGVDPPLSATFNLRSMDISFHRLEPDGLEGVVSITVFAVVVKSISIALATKVVPAAGSAQAAAVDDEATKICPEVGAVAEDTETTEVAVRIPEATRSSVRRESSV